ncbi:hypothetical protein R3P38DRAFT_2772163 [Favolaschia claudopus]|uniref:Uncharacterized protein n=1 Tax=Favolaschia claudopus TaxID=2862362 RepID=A0AAW0C9J0_9AGAR
MSDRLQGITILSLWYVRRNVSTIYQGKEARFTVPIDIPVHDLHRQEILIYAPVHQCCNETHWKYNYKQHLAERHPDWQRLIPVTFLPELQISREELLELKIPSHLGCLAPTAKAFYSVDSSHSLYAEKTVGNITG